CFFFFSSRRRHTRFSRDWSSDVCSSDLALVIANTQIRQDAAGRYCLNDLHQASGGAKRHQPGDWLRLKQTQELVAEVLADPVARSEERRVGKEGRSRLWSDACKQTRRDS